MIVVRRVESNDFEQYVELAFSSNINFYTLPKNRELLENLFENALNSFKDEVEVPNKEFYIFVAEDTETKKLLGVSALSATSGGVEPLFFYKRETITNNSSIDRVIKNLEVLKPVSYPKGPSEVCSLFVLPAARGSGVGKLLSFSRFLFVACFPNRFTKTFIAELRGKVENGTSPFWECVGRHFLDATFEEVQEMLNYGKDFIKDFLPSYPLYVPLLPRAAQDVLGKVDSETEAALLLLNRLGFTINSEVDVIDAGPKLIAQRDSIFLIAHSQKVAVEKIAPCTSKKLIITNEKLDFRAAFGEIENGVLSPDAAKALKVTSGDTVRIFDPKSFS